MFRGRFTVDSFEGERGQLALDLLRGGESVVVGDRLALTCEDKRLRIEVASAWSSVGAVTESVAAAELGAARDAVAKLLTDPGLDAVVGDRQQMFELVIDHGTGTELVASLHDGEVTMTSRD